MKEYAESFYKGKQWRKVRAAYLKSVHGICERCGMPATMVHHKHYIPPYNINDIAVILNFENLEALCQECHNKEHHSRNTQRRYTYDEHGNIILTAQEYERACRS